MVLVLLQRVCVCVCVHTRGFTGLKVVKKNKGASEVHFMRLSY